MITNEAIEDLILHTLIEASSEDYFTTKANAILNLRSEIDKKSRQTQSLAQRESLQKISSFLIEAERVLGQLVQKEEPHSNYTPINKLLNDL